MQPKHIVIFSEDFPPYSGGIAQWAYGIASGLQAMGHDIRVFTRDRPEFAKVEHPQPPFHVDKIPGNRWRQLRTLYCQRTLQRHYRQGHRPDLLIATTWNMARGLVSFALKHRTKLVVVVHGLEVTRRMPLLKRLWLHRTLQVSDLVIAVSQFTRDRLLAKYSLAPEKVRVFPNGVDVARFAPGDDATILRQKLGLGEERIILTLARVIERKGHEQVIRALPRVIARVPSIKYLICGPWDEAYYQRLQAVIAELHLQGTVIFTGYVEPAALRALYNLCAVYIMPSRELAAQGDTEGFGITFLEANACEKPVIGGRSGGVEDAIVDGETGFLVDPLSCDEIAEKLLLLLQNPELARKMGQQGRQRIERAYTWEIVARQVFAAIFPPAP